MIEIVCLVLVVNDAFYRYWQRSSCGVGDGLLGSPCYQCWILTTVISH